MALDHYVSQVHLKNFYSPELDGLMYTIRKSDLKRFSTKSQDVCRIEEGRTNAYLTKDRAIEEFLKSVEPCYNASLAKLRENKLDQGAIASLAGFVAYVVSCSPTAMRLYSGPLKALLEAEAIEGFVSKNRGFRIELVTHKLRQGAGHLLLSTHRILPRSHEMKGA